MERVELARELVKIAGVLLGIDSGPGCCRTTLTERREKKKWYKKNRRKELKKRRKFEQKVTQKTRERPGGKSGDKRRFYRPRDYPPSIQQPDRQSLRNVTVRDPGTPRRVPKVHVKEVEPTVQVRKIETE